MVPVQFEIRAAVSLKDSMFIRANYSANADIVLETGRQRSQHRGVSFEI